MSLSLSCLASLAYASPFWSPMACFDKEIGDFHAVKKIKRLEKAPGEWNHYRIEVKGDTVRAFINGELANEGSGIDVLAGPIGLQTEGSEIHFKNVRLEPLKAD